MNSTNSLSGQTVVILGGSAGIGLATARLAAEEGANVVIVSSNQSRVNTAVQSLPVGNHWGVAVDLSKETNIADFFKNISTFDHLIYTAGENLSLNTIDQTNLEQAQRFFNVRYWGAYAAVKYGSPKINVGGSIVLTGGTAGCRGGNAWSIASSICGAMEGLTRSLAVELAPIRVNCIVPGFVKTDLWSGIDAAELETMFANAASTLPVRHVAKPEEIALGYIYLLKQTYSTAQSVIIDGGGLQV